MIESTTKLQVMQRMRKDKVPIRKFATNTIKINRVRDDLQALLNDRLAEISQGAIEEKWNAFKLILYKRSKEKLGTTVRKHKDLLEGNSMELDIQEKISTIIRYFNILKVSIRTSLILLFSKGVNLNFSNLSL